LPKRPAQPTKSRSRTIVVRVVAAWDTILAQNLPDRPVWEPTRRIRNARRKLDGFNPVALLVDDLKQNPAVDKFNSLVALEAILRRG